jgi:hypothetical protein
MRIDDKTTIINPTITLSWSWQPCEFTVMAKYDNERNSYGRSIGKFIYSNGWVWQPNSDNTEDVQNHFAALTIEDLNVDNLEYYTPPTMSGYIVAIPPQFEWVFRNDRFEINGFVVDFIRTPDDILAVDIAYLQWEAFRLELDKPENATVKNSLEPIWDYVLKQINNGNFI